jgi:hypothetical protein
MMASATSDHGLSKGMGAAAPLDIVTVLAALLLAGADV